MLTLNITSNLIQNKNLTINFIFNLVLNSYHYNLALITSFKLFR